MKIFCSFILLFAVITQAQGSIKDDSYICNSILNYSINMVDALSMAEGAQTDKIVLYSLNNQWIKISVNEISLKDLAILGQNYLDNYYKNRGHEKGYRPEYYSNQQKKALLSLDSTIKFQLVKTHRLELSKGSFYSLVPLPGTPKEGPLQCTFNLSQDSFETLDRRGILTRDDYPLFTLTLNKVPSK